MKNTHQFVYCLDSKRVWLFSTCADLSQELVTELCDLNHFVTQLDARSFQNQWQVDLNWLKTESFEDSAYVSRLDDVLARCVVILHRLIERLAWLIKSVRDLAENLIFYILLQLVFPLTNVGVKSHNELVVAYLLFRIGTNQINQVLNLIVTDSDFQSSKPLTQFFSGKKTISVSIEKLESFFQAEILDIECSGNLVQSFIQSDHFEILCLKLLTEWLEVNFANALWVCDSAKNSLILNCKWQIQSAYKLLKKLDRDQIFVWLWVIARLEGVEKRDLSLSENLSNLAYKMCLSFLELRRHVFFLFLSSKLLCFSQLSSQLLLCCLT